MLFDYNWCYLIVFDYNWCHFLMYDEFAYKLRLFDLLCVVFIDFQSVNWNRLVLVLPRRFVAISIVAIFGGALKMITSTWFWYDYYAILTWFVLSCDIWLIFCGQWIWMRFWYVTLTWFWYDFYVILTWFLLSCDIWLIFCEQSIWMRFWYVTSTWFWYDFYVILTWFVLSCDII